MGNPKQSRPEWLITTVIPAAPMTVRPSVQMGSGMRAADDITYLYREVIKCNEGLRRSIASGNAQHIISDEVAQLQFHAATIIDNTLPGFPRNIQKSGRPHKSISERLKTKEGRIRGNLMGKRVDFSARTVITGDPNLK